MSTWEAQVAGAYFSAEISLPVGPVEHVEEAILGRLHQHLGGLSIDRDVGQDHVLGGGVVPHIARRGLVVPDVLARVGIHRDDGGEEEVVALARAAQVNIPVQTVADADVEQIQLRVVGEGIPGGAATAPIL